MQKVILLSMLINLAVADQVPLALIESSTPIKPALKPVESIELVGGWYPVFFNKYSNTKVLEIVDGIKTGKIKRLIISYDENKLLAMQIRTNIQAKVNFAIQMEHVPLTDSDSTQFNHSQVVVTVYTR